MKKLLLVLAIVLLAVPAFAQTWHTANQHTVSWNAGDGAVSYNLFLKPAKGGDLIQIGNVTDTQAVFTLPGVGRYYACAQSVSVDGDVSEISCSDVAENCKDGVTFGLKINPGKPTNLR